MHPSIIAILDSGVKINLQIEFCDMTEHALRIRRESRLVHNTWCHERE